MLEYARIDISEGIDVNKTNPSKECDISLYWTFLDKNFNYETYICNGCHNLMQKAINFNDVAIVSIKGNDYRVYFWYMSKNNVVSIMNNYNFKKNWIHINFFLLYIKNEWNSLLLKKNREMMLNRANEYYENNK